MADILDDLVDLLENGHRYENYIASCCPFHEDHRPSFLVYDDYYKCLACDAHGKTSTLLDKLKGNPPKPKLKSWHNPFTSWLRDQSLSEVMKSAWRTIKNSPSQGSYLKKRGVSLETQLALGIGWRDGYYTFPILDEKRKLIGAVARVGEGLDLPAKYVCPAGQDPNLILVPDWDIIEKARDVYCVFGILDTITLYLYNIPSFSTTNGKRIDPSALDKFRKRIIFLPDRGEEPDAIKIASKLGWRGVVPKMNYPDGTKDLNDIHMKYPEIIDITFFKDTTDGRNMARWK